MGSEVLNCRRGWIGTLFRRGKGRCKSWDPLVFGSRLGVRSVARGICGEVGASGLIGQFLDR